MTTTAETPSGGHRLISLDELASRLSISKAMIYRLIQRKDFPRPVKIGKASRWDEGQVNQWVESRLPTTGESN